MNDHVTIEHSTIHVMVSQLRSKKKSSQLELNGSQLQTKAGSQLRDGRLGDDGWLSFQGLVNVCLCHARQVYWLRGVLLELVGLRLSQTADFGYGGPCLLFDGVSALDLLQRYCLLRQNLLGKAGQPLQWL